MILTYYIPLFDITGYLRIDENDRVFDLRDRIFERNKYLFSDNRVVQDTLDLSKVSHPRTLIGVFFSLPFPGARRGICAKRYPAAAH